MGRKFSFFVQKPFVPHFNASVGSYVSSEQQFNNELHRLSDAQTERTGIEHNYVRVDQADSAALGATEESMDNFYRRRYDNPVATDFEEIV